MKLFLIITFTYLLLGNSSTIEHHQQKCFYFCESRPIDDLDSTSSVLYTDIKESDCDTSNLKSVAAKWGAVADSICQSKGGCTSDLNYYLTKDDAQKNLDKFISLYRRSKLEKVNF